MQNGTGGQGSGALIRLDAREAAGPCPTRPLAAFLMQLIACRAHLAPYRPRRRAEPGEASDRYGEAGRRPVPPRRFERVL